MPELLTRTDIVAAFRSDLKLGNPVKGAGEDLVQVTDPKTGASTTFRGFELSIARMLNGQRNAGAVVAAAREIGLPVTLEGLSAFVKRLGSLGFLADRADPIANPTTWPQRREWNAETRTRYQLALKEARRDQLRKAKHHLDELRRAEPDNIDVKELHEWVSERLRRPTAGEALPRFPDIFDAVERSWFEEGERESAENEHAHHAAARRARWKWILPIVLLLLAAGVALVPLPNTTKGTFELAARNSVSVTATQAGVVGSVAVLEGQWVETGTKLFLYDTQPAKQKLADAESQIAELQKQLDESSRQVDEPRKQLEDARAALAAAQAELDKATGDAKHQAKKTRRQVEANLKQVEAATAKALAALDPEIAAKIDELKAKVAAATAERDAQKPLSELAPVTAPAAGFVVGFKLKVGDPVKSGAPVCKLDDTKVLVVKMSVDKGETMTEHQTATLKIDGKDVDVKIEKIESGEGRGVLDNPSSAFKAGTKGDLSIDAGKKSLAARLF